MKIDAISGDHAPPRSFGRDTSRYVIGGHRVPSVTEVIKIAGLSDIQRIIAVAGADVVQKAADRGQRVHKYCEIVDLEPDLPLESVTEDCRGYVLAYQRFLAETGFAVDLTEEALVSETHGMAGTIDRVGLLYDEVAVLEVKTPQSPDPSWQLQTAGYSLLVTEGYGIPVPARYVLRLGSNGRYQLIPHTDRTDFDVFLAALRVAHYRLAHELASLEE